MDAEMIERLRQELRDLDLPASVIEAQIAQAVEAFARPVSDSDRATVELQRRDVYSG